MLIVLFRMHSGPKRNCSHDRAERNGRVSWECTPENVTLVVAVMLQQVWENMDRVWRILNGNGKGERRIGGYYKVNIVNRNKS